MGQDIMSNNLDIQLEQPNKQVRKILTCIIGGSCSDDVVIIGDSKVTFEIVLNLNRQLNEKSDVLQKMG
jgi:hypothetical protein